MLAPQQNQDPLNILSSLVASQLQLEGQGGGKKQKDAATVELNAYQKGVNKMLLKAGEQHAMEAIQGGMDPQEIAKSPMMGLQQQQIQGNINNQAQELLQPQQRTFLGNLLNGLVNLTGIPMMNEGMDAAKQRNKLSQLETIQKLAGTQQGPEADLQRVQARDYGARTNIEQQNARTNAGQLGISQQNADSTRMGVLLQANRDIIDNVLKQQQATGTQVDAESQLKLAQAQDYLSKAENRKNLTPEAQMATLRQGLDLMKEMGIEGTGSVTSEGVFTPDNKDKKNSAYLQAAQDKRTENFITAVENNNVKRDGILEAQDAMKRISSGFYGKVSRNFLKNLSPDSPILGDWQKIKMVLTDAQLANVAFTKGAISDAEMRLFSDSAANDDLMSIPKIIPVMKKVLNFVNASEKAAAKSYGKIYGEDPYKWTGIESNIGNNKAISEGWNNDKETRYQELLKKRGK